MGIYGHTGTRNHKRHDDGTETWEEVTELPGVKTIRNITAGVRREERTDCFCCTCGDDALSDAACRNHGYYGKRPCDIHNMPGQVWDQEPGDTSEPVMPMPVKEYREAVRDGRPTH